MQATAKQSKYRLHEAKMLQQDSANSNYQPLNLGFRPRKCYTRHAALLGNASAPLVQNVMPDIRLKVLWTRSVTPELVTTTRYVVTTIRYVIAHTRLIVHLASSVQQKSQWKTVSCTEQFARSCTYPHSPSVITSHSLCAFYVLKEPQKRNEEIMANFKHLTGSKKNTCFKAHRIP